IFAQNRLEYLPDRVSGNGNDDLDTFGYFVDSDTFVLHKGPDVFNGWFFFGSGDNINTDLFSQSLVWHSDSGNIKDIGMTEKHIFDFLGTDVKTTAYNDILGTIKESDTIIIFDLEKIAGVEEAILVEGLLRQIRPFKVTGNDIRAAIPEFSNAANFCNLLMVDGIQYLQMQVFFEC